MKKIIFIQLIIQNSLLLCMQQEIAQQPITNNNAITTPSTSQTTSIPVVGNTATRPQLITGFQITPSAPSNPSCWNSCISDANLVFASPITQDLEAGLQQEIDSLPATSTTVKVLQFISNNIMNAHIQNANALATTNQTIQTTAAKHTLLMAALGAVNLGFILYTAFGK